MPHSPWGQRDTGAAHRVRLLCPAHRLSCSPSWGRSCHGAAALRALAPQRGERPPRSGPPSCSAGSDPHRGWRARLAAPGSLGTPRLQAPGISRQAFFASCACWEQAKDSTPFVSTNLTSEKKGLSPQGLWRLQSGRIQASSDHNQFLGCYQSWRLERCVHESVMGVRVYECVRVCVC